uniref:Acyltransferase n=1 Tax=Nannochloropsis gaditana (strain CCMP526) TaxID=1093141 RepID=I2CR10_NANGC
MTPQAETNVSTNGVANSQTASSPPSSPGVQYKAAGGKMIRVALAARDNGDMSLFREALAMLTMGVMMSWYYLVVILSLLCVAGLFFPTWRVVAGTAFVLMWSAAFLPLDYQGWDAFCNSFLFKLWRDYFHYEYILEEAIDPKKRYLFAEMPHGIFPWGEVISISITKQLFPGSRVGSIGASVIFLLPGLRHFFSWIGCRPASPENIKKIFEEGADCAVTVGGVAEMFLVGGDKERLYLKKHKGFIREAIKNGADVVPVFCYGNSKLFSVVGESSRLSMGLLKRLSRRIKASILIFYGRLCLPIPIRHPLLFVVGKPLPVVQKDAPSKEEIAAMHALFCEKVEELYYKFRPEWETRPLSIE